MIRKRDLIGIRAMPGSLKANFIVVGLPLNNTAVSERRKDMASLAYSRKIQPNEQVEDVATAFLSTLG